MTTILESNHRISYWESSRVDVTETKQLTRTAEVKLLISVETRARAHTRLMCCNLQATICVYVLNNERPITSV